MLDFHCKMLDFFAKKVGLYNSTAGKQFVSILYNLSVVFHTMKRQREENKEPESQINYSRWLLRILFFVFVKKCFVAKNILPGHFVFTRFYNKFYNK